MKPGDLIQINFRNPVLRDNSIIGKIGLIIKAVYPSPIGSEIFEVLVDGHTHNFHQSYLELINETR